MQTAPQRVPFVARGEKSLIFLNNGKKLIDAVSSWWLITHGHCEPSLVRAVKKQAESLDHVLFADFTHEQAEKLVRELAFFLPPTLQKFFFSDNGSTAVEIALKMAVQAQVQSGQAGRKKFLSFTASYHGDTAGAMSVGAGSFFRKTYKPLLFSVRSCSQGRYSFDPDTAFYEDFERKINRYGKSLAGVIIEPLIQGAGGMIVWPPRVLERICRITKQAGAFLIFDEIMTGFGRTGTVFAFEQIKSRPDIICLSKALTGGFLPLALTVTSEKLYRAFLSPQKTKALLHGHSWTGNPLACAAAVANLKLLRKNQKKLLKKWRAIESLNKERLLRLKTHPQVKDTRCKGLIGAVEKRDSAGYSSAFAEKAKALAFKRGVFLRPLGGTVYVLPPYCITEKQLHTVWDVIESLYQK